MKAADLRKSILQMAVQGKLVPQDPHDEPASELLARIKAEKARLIKDGKIKKEKPLPSIAEDEIPYDLPNGWVWCRLIEVTSIIGDGIHGTPEFDDSGDYYFVNGNNLDTSDYSIKYHPSTKRLTKREYEKYSKPLSENTIFLSINGTIGNIAFYKSEKIILGKSAAYINLLSDIEKKYLALFFKSHSAGRYFKEKHTGTTIKNLSLAAIRSCTLPLPPLAEQQRIVAKVDELMAMCNELEAAEKELDNLENYFIEYLPKSILQMAVQGKLVTQDLHDEPASELLGRIRIEKERLTKEGKLKKEKPLSPIEMSEIPYELPRGWYWCRLGDVSAVIMGQSPKGDSVGTDIGLEFHQGKSSFENIYLRESDILTSDPLKIAEIGDVLLAVRAPVGDVNITRRKICIGRGLSAIRPLSNMKAKFLYYFLTTMKGYFNLQATGTTFVAISLTTIRNAVFPLPPLAEQQRIVAKLDELMVLCDELKSAQNMVVPFTAGGMVIPFPSTVEKEEALLMVAQGIPAKEQSAELRQTIDDLFGDDDE